MPELGQTNFSAGWTPTSDARNAPENGLLRMDNMVLDDEGVLTSIRGTAPASTDAFGSDIRNLWSKRIFKNGITHYYRYVHLVNGDIYSTPGGESDLTHPRLILTGGNSFLAAFGNSGEYALICSGDQNKKDDGEQIKDLGIETPTAAPTIVPRPNHSIDLTTNYASFNIVAEADAKQGTIISADASSIVIKPNIDNHRVIVRSNGSFNFGLFSGGEKADPYDKFNIRISGSLESAFTYITVNFMTVPRSSPYDPNDLVSNYSYTFTVEGNGLTQDFSIERKDFIRSAYSDPLEWTNITQVEIIVTTSGGSSTDEIRINLGKFVTYVGNLSGTYQWVQVNGYKHPTSNKISISPVGIETDLFQLNDERVAITPQLPTTWSDDTNVIWIFRRRIENFDTYYRTAAREDISEFDDTQTDRQIIGRIGPIERIDDDRTIIPERIDWFVEHPPSGIIGVSGPYFGRTVYLTEDKIYLSRIDDPDCVDSRYTFDVSGNSSERNLWVKQVGDSLLLIGTTIDIYALSGTMRSFEDGSVDAILRPYGIDSPPISRYVTSYEDNLIYMSKEGWRILSGPNSILITGQTRGLYEEKDLHGFGQVYVVADVSRRFDCVVSRSKLYCIVDHDPNVVNPLNRDRTLLIYDFQRRYWMATDLAPTCLWAEEHGVVLAGFGSSYVSLDRPTIYATSTTNIRIRTPFLYGGSPNNRKDVETLKIYADSNGQNLSVYLRVNGIDTTTLIGSYAWNGPEFKNIDINSIEGITLGKSFSLELVGSNLALSVKLFTWSINFSPRPEQKNYQRITPTNFGVAGRKRFYDLPFSIDSLGTGFTVTPRIDGILTPESFAFSGSNLGKEFKTIAFSSEIIGHELGLDIQSDGDGVHEFYEMISPRHTELLPDLQKFLHMPYNNLGTPSRKRFVRFAFVINTFGQDVNYRPKIDDVDYPPMVVNTNRKQTVIYYFRTNAEGTDIHGILDGSKFFEYYGPDLDETVSEVLPPPTKYLVIPSTNLGIPAKKRIRTIPLSIHTRGARVRYTPEVDGVLQTSSEHTTTNKRTSLHYFEVDVYGIDYGGILETLDDTPFEFYGFDQFLNVQTLPIGRKLDQTGPFLVYKQAWLREFEIRVVTTTEELAYEVFASDILVYSGTITTTPNQDKVYKVEFPKSYRGRNFRIEFSASEIFHRYYTYLKYSESGGATELSVERFGETEA